MKPQDRTRAILESGLPSTAKLVGVALADCCDAHDSAYPSVATLARRTSLDSRTVRRVLAEAEVAGWVRRQDRRGTSSVFSLALSALPAASKDDEAPHPTGESIPGPTPR